MTDSSTGGYLAPTSNAPASDTDLEDQLQQIVVGITAIDGKFVRPRWQPTPPKQPAVSVNWCAIGVLTTDDEGYAAIIHHPDGDGYDELQTHETLTVMASFYGPNGEGNAKILRDGMQIAQNREAMAANNLALIDVAGPQAAPALINEQWVRRYDLTIRIRRQITRTYNVLNLLSAGGTIHTKNGSQDWETPQET